jgi:basic membrane lipoprotein Med (substrate-binding protein (PBP1-ABC) superfamily)
MKNTCPQYTMDVRRINTLYDPVAKKDAAASLFDAGVQVVLTRADTPAVADVAQADSQPRWMAVCHSCFDTAFIL